MNRAVPISDARFYDEQKQAWSEPPVDGVGYISSARLLASSDGQLRSLIAKMVHERYAIDGWRNHGNKWRDLLGLDSTSGKIILDYGCGVGLESLQFARRNIVYAGDIVEANTRLAARVGALHDCEIRPLLLSTSAPFFNLDEIDIFYCNGVLHHIPCARQVLLNAAEALSPDGEIRLMLYTDRAWERTTKTPVPPVDADVTTCAGFRAFVLGMDSVGSYADWYNAEKIEHRFGDFLRLERFDYITSDDAFCVAILRPHKRERI